MEETDQLHAPAALPLRKESPEMYRIEDFVCHRHSGIAVVTLCAPKGKR
jgi:hypothetical protein